MTTYYENHNILSYEKSIHRDNLYGHAQVWVLQLKDLKKKTEFD